MVIIKRDGSKETFNKQKIVDAISKACRDVNKEDILSIDTINDIATDIMEYANDLDKSISVEEIQDLVEDHIFNLKKFKLGRAYSQYRFHRAILRNESSLDKKIMSIVEYNNDEVKEENSNKDPEIASVQRDYIAGETSKEIAKKYIIPPDLWKAHTEGLIHIHDLDYIVSKIHNCCLVNLEDMLQNGTVISGYKIETPHSFSTACNIMTQIMAQVASSQYGGQSMTLAHIAPFVDVSRQKIKKSLLKEFDVESYDDLTDEQKSFFDKSLNVRLQDEITKGVQIIQYQVATLMTTNGQAPFITLFMYIDEVPAGQLREDLVMVIAEVLKQRYQGIKNEKGVWVTPAFPKLIYVLDEDNINDTSRYFWVTKLAAKCTAKRMVPDYISAKVMKELKDDCVYPSMGCRSFLSVENNITDENGKKKFYGRFNQGVCTINLVDVACTAEGDIDKFWKIFDERLEMCHRVLQIRHNRLMGTPSDIAPIMWQYGALSRLKKGETIDKLLLNGYSTISLGYAGLSECVYRLTGKSHISDDESMKLGLSIMQHMVDKTNEWKAKENVGYSLYGSPIESTTYKFAKCLKTRFGVIENVTDHNYITNSYHCCVREKINAFDKLSKEAQFQKLSPGGAISYVEAPDLQNNIPAVIEVMRHIYNTILYAEINIKSDYCQNCGFDGEIKIIENEDGELDWECPNCGCQDHNLLNVARRTCGYIGSDFWNQGRTEEIKDRFVHLDNMNYEE